MTIRPVGTRSGWGDAHNVPNGYCGLKGTGVSCPIPASGLVAGD